MPSKDVCVVLCTAPPEESERLATALVEHRLAACVNIVNTIQSVYRWEGKVTTDRESLLIIKTPSNMVGRLREELVRLHPYDVPEVLSLDVNDGYVPYLDWIHTSVDKSAE